MEDEDKNDWHITIPLWIIIGILVAIASVLTQIRNNLRDINDATDYTSAAVDKLESIENILEDIRD